MVSVQWIGKRKANWARLEALTQSRKGLRGLNHVELQELGLLYRQVASDLAVVLEDKSSGQLGRYLNQLLRNSHNLIYLGRRRKAGGIIAFYRYTYPAIFRDNLRQTAIATAIFFVAAIAAWALTISDPAFGQRFLGPEMTATINRQEMWTHSVVTIKPLAASGITTNNLTVTFTTFALGITVIGTLWMMLLNGVMLGVVGAATWHAGMAMKLWSFVAPHGSLELPAIFIAGGAGLEVARGILFPGYLPRRESIARAGNKASKLVLGAVPLLLIAGTIEGFFSPGDSPVAMKFLLGAVLFSALCAWLFTTGTGAPIEDSDPSLPDIDSPARRTTRAH